MRRALDFLAGLERIGHFSTLGEWASRCALWNGAKGLCFSIRLRGAAKSFPAIA